MVWTNLHQVVFKREDIKLAINNNRKDIEQVDQYGRTPLHLAAEFNNAKAIGPLLENGANIEKERPGKLNALHTAVLVEAVESVSELLKYKASVNKADMHGDTSLHMVTKSGNLQITRLLMDNKANPSLSNNDKMTPLGLAVHRGQKEFIKLLVNTYKVDINQESKEGISPAHVGIVFQTLEFIEEFLDTYNIDINRIDNKGRSLLKLAAQYERPSVMKALLEHGANTNGISDVEVLEEIQELRDEIFAENFGIKLEFTGENYTYILMQ